MKIPISKELLELEHREHSSTNESKFFICNNEACVPRQRKNIKKSQSGGADERPMTCSAPKSKVLGKVKSFLEVMAEANKHLELSVQENPRINYDIEVLNGDEAECIEMDLLLGVADLQTPEAVSAAEAAIGGAQLPLPSAILSSKSDTEGSSSSDDDGNNDSDHESNSRCHGKKSCSAIRLESKPNKRPKIVVLD